MAWYKEIHEQAKEFISGRLGKRERKAKCLLIKNED